MLDSRNGQNASAAQNVDATSRNSKDEAEINVQLIGINRVAKTVKGGKQMRFAALVVAGDGKGRVGYGQGKSREAPDAVRKATAQAKVNMLRIPLRGGRTLHHDVTGRFGAAKVIARAAEPGTGVIAGGAMRRVFDALGVQDVVAKSFGSSNPYNVVKSTFRALLSSASPKTVAARRGKKVNEIISRKAEMNSAGI